MLATLGFETESRWDSRPNACRHCFQPYAMFEYVQTPERVKTRARALESERALEGESPSLAELNASNGK